MSESQDELLAAAIEKASREVGDVEAGIRPMCEIDASDLRLILALCITILKPTDTQPGETL